MIETLATWGLFSRRVWLRSLAGGVLGVLLIVAAQFDTSWAQMRQARVDTPLQPMSLAVLSRGNYSDDAPLPDWPVDAFERMWRAVQDDLATLVPHARFSIAGRAGTTSTRSSRSW